MSGPRPHVIFTLGVHLVCRVRTPATERVASPLWRHATGPRCGRPFAQILRELLCCKGSARRKVSVAAASVVDMSTAVDLPIGHPVAAAVAEIGAVLDHVINASMWSMTDADLQAVTAAAGRTVARVQALQVRLVGEMDSRDLGCRLGASTMAGWVRNELTVTLREAKQLASVATATRAGQSATGRALAVGRITLAHAAVIVAAIQALPVGLDPDIVVRAEADLIARAAHFDPEQLARLGQHILTVVAPEIGEALEAKRLADQEDRAARRREFTITPDGHGVEWLRGGLDTESAAILRAALAPLSVPRPTAADGPDLRTTAHRRADALVELARRALAADDLPDIGAGRPTVTLTLPLTALVAGLGAAVLDDGTRLSPAAARRIACDCRLIPAVLGGPSEILDIGRAQRLFTGPRRRALILRDRGCAFPGCDRPPSWCDAHHIRSWADGGTTTLNNGVLLCGHHHTVVHRDRWTILVAADGVPDFTPPPQLDPTGTPQRNHRHTQPG